MLKNVSGQNIAAQLIAKADGTPITSGTVTVYVTVDNGSQNAGSGTVSHKGNGAWNYAPTQGETNGNHVAYTWVHADAINVTKDVYPQAEGSPWTAGEKEQLRYRLQIDGTQTAPAADAPLQMPVSADAISQDPTAADNLEAMLDGNRAKLYLTQLDIQATGNDAAIIAFGSGNGYGMHIKGGSIGAAHALRTEAVGTNANGIFCTANQEADGFRILSAGPNRNGINTQGSEGGAGIYSQGGGSGAGFKALGLTGNDIDADINGNLSGSIGSLATQAKADVLAEATDALNTYDGATKTELDAAQAAIEALIDALNAATPAEVKDKIIEALTTDTYPEPTEAPAFPASLKDLIAWIAVRGLNKFIQTALDQTLRNANDTADIAKRSITANESQATLEPWD